MSSDVQPTPRRDRLSRSDLFMAIAELFGRRSTCLRAEVGCVAVLEGRIIASGYVGAPQGQAHCLDVGCEMENGHCVRTVHAEANLVAWAAHTGTPLLGSVLWCTHSPCRVCLNLLVNAGVKDVVYREQYTAFPASQLKALGIRLYHIKNYPPEWA